MTPLRQQLLWSQLRKNRPGAPFWVCRRCLTTAASRNVTPARTRFAPSPTGQLHLGSLRTALFNYLYAKATGGQFILRIEDTDRKRAVEGAEESIFKTLRWANLQWDEGPEAGGSYGPYRQSERVEMHREHAQRLLKSGHAYRCFCLTERLRRLGEQRALLGLPTDYDRTCIKLSEAESDERASRGETHVIRLKAPDIYPPFNDLVYGEIKTGSNMPSHNKGSYADQILLKSDGMPTYHLANVVDDHYMRITHVIRGTEWMASTPKHVHLYEAFNWIPPAFVHVGLLQNHQRKKLSKRDGDVEVSEFITKGYLADALNNFVALLGWSHPRTSDVLTMEDLIQEFSVENLTQGDAIVSFEKLNFLQKAHVKSLLNPEGLTETICNKQPAADKFPQLLKRLVPQVKARFNLPSTIEIDETILRCMWLSRKNYATPSQFIDNLDYFFLAEEDFSYAAESAVSSWEVIKKLLAKIFPDISPSSPNAIVTERAAELILPIIAELENISDDQWLVDNLTGILDVKALKEPGVGNVESKESRHKYKAQMSLLRYILATGKSGPSIPEIMETMKKRKVVILLKQWTTLTRPSTESGAFVGDDAVTI